LIAIDFVITVMRAEQQKGLEADCHRPFSFSGAIPSRHRALLVEREPERLRELARQLNSAMEERIRALSTDRAKGSSGKSHP
jgi:hypothetical protein